MDGEEEDVMVRGGKWIPAGELADFGAIHRALGEQEGGDHAGLLCGQFIYMGRWDIPGTELSLFTYEHIATLRNVVLDNVQPRPRLWIEVNPWEWWLMKCVDDAIAAIRAAASWD